MDAWRYWRRKDQRNKESKKKKKKKGRGGKQKDIFIHHGYRSVSLPEKDHDSPNESREMNMLQVKTEELLECEDLPHVNETLWYWLTVMGMTMIISHKPAAARGSFIRLFYTAAPAC